jgi:hypothetical protein
LGGGLLPRRLRGRGGGGGGGGGGVGSRRGGGVLRGVVCPLPGALRAPRVGVPGIEPGTSVLSGLRSNRLSYWPEGAGARTSTSTAEEWWGSRDGMCAWCRHPARPPGSEEPGMRAGLGSDEPNPPDDESTWGWTLHQCETSERSSVCKGFISPIV